MKKMTAPKTGPIIKNPQIQFNKPDKALSLLKLLDRKKITAEMLSQTKIGKKLAPIIDTPNPEAPELTDTSLLKEVLEMKQYLKKKWSEIYKKYKKGLEP